MVSKMTNQLALLAEPVPSHNARYSLALVTLVFATLTQADPARAISESIPCDPKPTDMSISYSDVVSCSIAPTGDVDIFRFSGTAGDVITILASESSVGVRTPCIELFDSGGGPVESVCSGPSARLDLTLGQTGLYSVLVSENNNDQAMGYTLSYQCIVGVCIDLTLFRDGFESGDTSAWSSTQ